MEVIKGIKEIASDRLATEQEVCYQLICEGVVRELKKKKDFQEFKNK